MKYRSPKPEVRFNDAPIHSIVQSKNGTRFIKLADAIPHVRLDKQPSNSLCLDTQHYGVLGSEAPVIVCKTTYGTDIH